MRARRLVFALIAALGIAAVGPAQAAVEDQRAYYKGKTVKLVVGYGPGGGYDSYARMIAAPLGTVLGATIVVENQPGAGGLTALNRLYMATPDGLQIMIVNGTAASESQLLQEPQVQYDLAEFGYLGIVSASPMMWMAGANAPVQVPADAKKPGMKVRWAAS